MLLLHQDLRFPILAQNLLRTIVIRCYAPITNTYPKIYSRKIASAKAVQGGGSSAALGSQADMNPSVNQAQSAKNISNPEPSARYGLE